ncbi:MAG: topoisomerase IV [Oscillospiraceae bacterium]|nr:topoisomerase IV [Oscillospiraceae bacterium]
MGAGETLEQPVTDTIEKNFMPYAMSVILSRAIPEIDGFKPSQRKILYTMYKMGLLTGARSKSANIVGQTMRLNPHGDAAIYETMVLLSKGYERLLHPWVDSKGNFGKAYSRDMAWAAPRYTEAKLEKQAAELFADIDKDTVEFTDNYDATMKEPVLLPVTFPTVLVNLNSGIAVGMASNICSFNLGEVCEATIALAKDPDADLLSLLPAPDFSGGGQILYDRSTFEEIYRTGRGSFRVRSKWRYDPSANCIDVYEIPGTTTAEAIIDKIVDLVKNGKIREISDVRDETDKSGLKITIDLKRGTDPEKLMLRLCKATTLEDSFPCNFNVLIEGHPRVVGVRDLLLEWIKFRLECLRRRINFDLTKSRDRLHLLEGLAKILLDIDKAVRVVRETEEEAEVIPNLMIEFGIDEVQAEFVAEIRLRHLNREYILKRTADIEKLHNDIADMEDILQKPARLRKIMTDTLAACAKAYSIPRKTEILYTHEAAAEAPAEEQIPDYPVRIFLTREGYVKKITPQSLRVADKHKLKEGDAITQDIETTNTAELLFFTDACQVYKKFAYELEDGKASNLGDYAPAFVEADAGERVVFLAVTTDFVGYLLFLFENGKMAKVDLEGYKTQTKRKKLLKAYSDKSPLAAALQIPADTDVVLQASSGRHLVLHTGAIAPKTTKDTQGVAVMTLKKGHHIKSLCLLADTKLEDPNRYRTKTLPAAGVMPPAAEQMRIL